MHKLILISKKVSIIVLFSYFVSLKVLMHKLTTVQTGHKTVISIDNCSYYFCGILFS